MNPNHIDIAETDANLLNELLANPAYQDTYISNIETWMGESGGAYNSGQNGTTNRFISGFWSLNEMSLLARKNFFGYCRQTLIGGNYGLIDKDTLQPNNDFFNYYLWKNLMGKFNNEKEITCICSLYKISR